MRKFWCYISNGIYSVGCTGQTVYVYDKEGKELAKFKDIKYGYKAVFSPTQNIFIVKSTGAYFAVYSLDTMSLIKIEPSYIEYDEHGQIYVFGFLRGDTGVISDGFVSKCNDNGLEDIIAISQEDYDYYHNFKSLEIEGFTEKAKEWSGFKYKNVDMTGMENMKFPLSELWKKYKKNMICIF